MSTESLRAPWGSGTGSWVPFDLHEPTTFMHPITSYWPVPAFTAPGLYTTHPTFPSLPNSPHPPGFFLFDPITSSTFPLIYNTWPLFPLSFARDPQYVLIPSNIEPQNHAHQLDIKICSRSSCTSPQNLHGVSHYKLLNTLLICQPVTHLLI